MLVFLARIYVIEVYGLKYLVDQCMYADILVSFATETVPVRTVNRQCSSGLQAVADVAAAIKAGFYDIG